MIQMHYNEEHGITPTPITKAISGTLVSNDTSGMAAEPATAKAYIPKDTAPTFAADPIIRNMSSKQIEKAIADNTALMKEAAARLDFLQAAQYRDEIASLQEMLEQS
jgi:excinuclease ABC subunit B